MNEELQLFQEDASEQLQYMENALLSAGEHGIDDEKIGEIFRAMHTIKGTAGMFGFSGVVDFTHIAENLLDEVRQHTVETNEQMLDLFLKCKDHSEVLINHAINDEEVDEQTLNNSTLLVDELLTYMPNNQTAIKQEITQNTQGEHLQEIATGVNDIWHVSIRFNEDFFTSGMDVLSIFSFFNKMGEIIINIPILTNLPDLEELDPLKVFIGFELEFQTDVGYEEIEEIFEFIIDDVTLHIFRHKDTEKLQVLLDTQSDDTLKNIFLDECIYDEEQLCINNDSKTTELSLDEITQSEDQGTIKTVEAKEKDKTTQNEVAEVKKDNVTKVAKPIKDKKKTKEVQKSFSLRVDSAKVDQLVNQISEMVIANAKITQIATDKEDSDLEEAANVLTDMLEDVRNGIMNIRMVQVEDSFVKFKRIVNDTAKKIGKDIDFIISGGETELDKTVVEKISDPLVHMLRNSVDHGVETPDIRVQNGKNPKGKVELKAYPDAGSIVIQVSDDGAGLDAQKLFDKAVSKGIINESDNLTNKEIYNLIFEAGFSTAEKVSDISGRGVGMDVVRRNIQDLRGMIDIDSTLGEGTTFTIRLPLTLAIIDGFLVQAGDTKYVIPLENIQECIELTDEYKKNMEGNQFINLRGEILPILDVKKYLNIGQEEKELERENVIVVRYANTMIGIQVDELYGEYQTVIKPLGDVFENVSGISGGSILGTGEVSLIFDIPKLIEYRIQQQ
mgnify:CR=1 FL=1